MMDGVSTMDDGSNRLLMQLNVESIAEVKVLVSNYQAEYGRSSGLQITAVTKSGTNRFRGSIYDVERNSDWGPNSKTNNLNGNPKTVSQARDWGYSIGGPIGKPGGTNKIFFYYAHEFEPRTAGNNVNRYRMPTAAERMGDFSATTDQNGAPYPYIKDPNLTGACPAASQAACFTDGGVLGKMPANRLYQTGLNILNMFPLPNCPAECPTYLPTSNFNYEVTRPNEQLLGWQPVIRLDYQPTQSLRATFKFSAWDQRNQVINGSIPGFNDTKMYDPTVHTWAVSTNYTLTPTMFLEATYGRSLNQQTGCSLGLVGGPSFCTSALPMNASASLAGANLSGLPFLFPDATIIEPRYYQYQALNDVQPPIWDGTRISKVPTFAWGNRVSNAPPTIPYPGILNTSETWDLSVNLTKVKGRHTLKAGMYYTHAYKGEPDGAGSSASLGTISFQQDAVGTNPCDTSFGFANAAMGCFSSFQQASKFVEVAYIYYNLEGYLQDNWKVNDKLTLDYGVRLVRVGPAYDRFAQATNFLPEEWASAQAPVMYVPGCVNNANPCSGSNRQAKNPITGQLQGPNSSVNIGALVPGSGNLTNGLFHQNEGPIGKTPYTYPAMGLAPRFGAAYDVTGAQKIVVRGGGGLFFERPSITAFETGSNPPTSSTVTVRYGQLQSLGSAGLTTNGVPALDSVVYESKPPKSFQWNGGVQLALPWAISLDVEYVGQHSWHTNQTVNINAIDFGEAFLPENQDATLPASTTPGATALPQDLLRAYQGYGTINQQWDRGWRTYHSIQWSFQRRFSNGISFGFNDTMGLYDHQNSAARLQHAADGSYTLRADQADADALIGVYDPQTHIMKANFVWDMPDLRSDRPAMRILGYVLNDWQLSGIWTGSTGSTYTVSANYSSGGTSTNLTGSPNYGARVRIVGDPGIGCNGNDVYRQFNTAAFQGPLVGSVGLESGNSYLRGCMSSVLDLSLARSIRLGGGRVIQLRADFFNAPNEGRITGRNTTMNLSNPTDPVTITNLPFDPITGEVLPNRVRPNQAGFRRRQRLPVTAHDTVASAVFVLKVEEVMRVLNRFLTVAACALTVVAVRGAGRCAAQLR